MRVCWRKERRKTVWLSHSPAKSCQMWDYSKAIREEVRLHMTVNCVALYCTHYSKSPRVSTSISQCCLFYERLQTWVVLCEVRLDLKVWDHLWKYFNNYFLSNLIQLFALQIILCVLQCKQGNLSFLNKGVNIFLYHNISLFYIFQNPKTLFISKFKLDFESRFYGPHQVW